MLNTLRGSISGWTAKILLGLLVVSFAAWGIGDVFRGDTATTVLTAGETEVSLEDYALAYNRAEARLAQQIGRRPTTEEADMFGIDQSVLSQLVAGAMLDEQGRRIGLGLSEDRLARLIADDPAFQDASGNFSRNAFQGVLANARIRERDYIRSQEDAAIRSQIVEAISEGGATPVTFETALGLYNGERRTVDYVSLPPSVVPPVADPSDDVLKTYFEDNKAIYAAPEFRSITYAVLTPEALSDPSSITDEQVAADYEQGKNRYTAPERRRVQQIVFPDRTAAEAAKAKLDAGATFETVAEEAGRTVEDTNLGLVAKSEIPDPKIAEAAFALSEGEISDVVDGAFGPAVLRVSEVRPVGVRPLEEVSDEIRKELALIAANETAATAYNTFEDARAGGASFAEAAKAAGISVETVPAVDSQGDSPEGGPIPDLPAKEELLAGAFETEPGFDNVPINFESNSYVFYDVVSIDPARDRTFEEVRDRVLADWREKEIQRLLGERADALKDELEAGKSMADIAAEAGVQKQTAASITRQSGAATLGQAGVAAAFSGGDGTIATARGRDGSARLVLKVTEVAPPADPAANVGANERQQLKGIFENDLLQSYVLLLQNETPLSVSPAAIENAKAIVR